MRRLALAIAVAAAFASGQSGAATINVDTVTATWGNVAPGSGNSLSGVGTSQLRWGTPVEGQQSGYGFVGLSTKGNDVEKDFQLGTFTHYNNPIRSGTSITETTLSFSVGLTIDGTTKTVASAFKFKHNETSNLKTGQTCANGALHGAGVNANGCADQVTFLSALDMLGEFQIGSAIYAMQIRGFLLDGKTVTEFWTKEKALNMSVP
jgi:hypothetical protein